VIMTALALAGSGDTRRRSWVVWPSSSPRSRPTEPLSRLATIEYGSRLTSDSTSVARSDVKPRKRPISPPSERLSRRSKLSASLTLPRRLAYPSALSSPSNFYPAEIAAVHRFADLKRGLSAVTDSEWDNLPEVSNMTGKKTKRNPRFEREYAMPDSVTLGNMASNATEGQLTDAQMVSNRSAHSADDASGSR
jgi:hypothetical protein